MFVLSLIAVLAGTPLRLAEAADDLARSLAETDNGVNLEQVDGGVGDDSGATIKPDVSSTTLASTFEQILLSPVTLPANLLDGFMCASAPEMPVGGLPHSGHPCARLQRFLC
jgi:hypothetical protein